jgi:hypothetical protein
MTTDELVVLGTGVTMKPSRTRYKTNSWRGRLNPRRAPCPHCHKRGLGPLKLIAGVVGQNCRYCQTFTAEPMARVAP